MRGGPNRMLSLTQGRESYRTCRASDTFDSAKVRRPRPDELTARSMRSIIPPTTGDEPFTYSLRNNNDGSLIETLDLLCPPDAREEWQKRLAVVALYRAARTSAGESLNFANLSHADLRDLDLSGQLGDVDFFQASLDEADLFLSVLHGARMIGTTLRGANMRSMLMCDAILHFARLDGADLTGARLIGTRFTYGSLREANLSRVNANNADFSEANLSGADLTLGSFEGACFDDAIFTGATITNAWFGGATFNRAVLVGVNLTTANFSGAIIEGAIINHDDLRDIPVVPDIHKAVYAAASAPDALDMRTWHMCETTHCRAGWVVTLAGEAGAALEEKYTTETAATLIYLASDPLIKAIPDFHASDDDALADMRRLAVGEG